jgi:molybdate transport system substrate-binding protein
MPSPLKLISSMATKQVLAELIAQYHDTGAARVELEAVGGVDAAKRVQAGESFDVIVLAANVIDQLTGSGQVVAGSRADLVRSGVAVAVREGAVKPDIGTEDAVKQAVLAAKSLSYSTGPSGTHLMKVFERWGIADQVKSRMVQAQPGIPVGSLIAKGEAELGFQQFSELMHLKGITVLGPLPPEIQIITTFSGGVAATSADPAAARALLAFLASPAAGAAKARNGMEAA